MDIQCLRAVVEAELASRRKRPKYQNSELSWIIKYLSAYEKRLEAEANMAVKDSEEIE